MEPQNSNQQPTVTETTPSQTESPAPPTQTTNTSHPLKKKNVKTIAIGVGAALVLLGGSAAAYFGYVVPNRPDNVVLSALTNMINQDNIAIENTIEVTPKEGGLAVAVDIDTEYNKPNNQVRASGTVGISGTQYPFDVRFIDKNLYMKVGGLEGLMPLIEAQPGFDPAYGEIIRQVNDQWYVVDKSFWQSMGQESTCFTDLTFSFTEEDTKLIKAAYKKHPLFKVESSSKEKVGDTDTTKYVVKPTTDAEAQAFLGELENVSLVKKIKECAKNTGTESLLDEEVSDLPASSSDDATIAIYVTSDKKLKKVESASADSSGTYKVSSVFDYRAIKVDKPEGAKPVQDLVSQIMGGGLGASSLDMSSAQAEARDIQRKNDLKNLQMKLETYYNDNGSYPLKSRLSDAGISNEELIGPSGDAYIYTTDSFSYELSAELENPDDPDAENGLYILRSIA